MTLSWDKLLTKRQQEISNDIKNKNPIHIILEGAVRSGKTILGIMFWMSYISQFKDKLFIMTGQTISSLKRNVLDEITKMFGVETHLNMAKEWYFNGNKIACFGSDKIDSFKSMRGLTAQGWYANEVILSHQNSILEAFARCSEKDKRIIWETNPDRPSHWIKTNYIDNSGKALEDGTINILSYHFQLEDNTFLDKNYIEGLKMSIPKGTIYERQIMGLWKATEQAIYSNYTQVNSMPRSYDDIAYGIDFGYNNPSAMVKCLWKDQSVYVELLFYESHLTNSQLCDKVKQSIQNTDFPIYCDSAEPDKIQELKDAGINAFPANKNVKEGINAVQQCKLYLVNNNINLIHEFENYEWRKNSEGIIIDEPVPIFDHAVSAVRYCIYTHNRQKINDLTNLKCEDMEREYKY